MQNFVDAAAAFAFAFQAQSSQRFLGDRRRPAGIEQCFRGHGIDRRLGQRQLGRRLGHPFFPRNKLQPPTTFMPALFSSRVDQKIRERPEQKRPKTAAIRIRRLKKISFHDHEEKILRQVLGVRRGITAAINKSENRAPVDLANLREPGIDLARRARRHALPDQAPTRRHEMR